MTIAVLGSAVGVLVAVETVSFAIIFNTTHTFHVAHAAVMTISGYVAYSLIEQAHFPLWLGLILSVIAGAVAGIVIDRSLYSWLRSRGASGMIIFMASVGLVTVVEGAVAIIWGPGDLSFSSLPNNAVYVGSVAVSPANLAMYAGLILIFAVVAFTVRTRSGRMLRAAGDSLEAAKLLGLRTEVIYVFAFAIGSALIALVGFILGWYEGLSPSMGLSVVFLAAAGTIIGGRYGLLPGAIIGFVVGLAQVAVGISIGTTWQDAVVYGVLLVVIVSRPSGLFGNSLRL